MSDEPDAAIELNTPYRSVAIYLKDSDSIEYVRTDVPSVHRRVDSLLTLVLDMRSREAIGFRLKGFRSFYLNELKALHTLTDGDFLAAVSVLERAMTQVGGDVFDRLSAYKTARQIAWTDQVQLSDLPQAA